MMVLAGTKVSTTGLAHGTRTTTSVMMCTVAVVVSPVPVDEADGAADEMLLGGVMTAVAGQIVV
jgi:hypothetical protein